MLKALDIENIAVIEKTSVEFTAGLNVLTGETGAGKSIVVDSINAILGERTSRELVRHGAEYGFVRAYFDDVNNAVLQKLSEFDIDDDEGDVILSRKIGANGKSVCKINGKSVTVSMLREIGALLVNIHGQNDSLALLDTERQYSYIDMLLPNKSVIIDFKKAFNELRLIHKQLKTLSVNEADKEKELELLNYQINELEAADIKLGEKEKLSQRRALILKSEALTKALSFALLTVNGDDNTPGIKTALDSAQKELVKFDEAQKIVEALAEASDKLELANDGINSLLAETDFIPQELEQIEERLDLLYEFSSKYGESEQEMIAFLENAKQKRKSILFADKELERLTAQYNEQLAKTVELADILSSERKKTALEFEKRVKSELEFLDMPKLKFIVAIKKGKLTSSGYDNIEFLISTNPGEPPKSLSKIASGGELSRIMLAIKSIIAYNDTIGTLIFDEIDTGVSGRASQKIGLKLKSVSKHTQVICVTHSAQIASNADSHFLIKKEFKNGNTYTDVSLLDLDGRKYELARIMGGLEITETLLTSATEMLLQNQNGN